MKDFPVIKLVLAFSTGLFLAEFFPINISLDFIIIGILSLISVLVFYFEKRKLLFPATSAIILFLVICLGYTDQNINLKGKNFLPDTLQVARDFTAFGKIKKINLPVQTGFSFLLTVDSVDIKKVSSDDITILCRLDDDSSSVVFSSFHPGNRVMVHGIYRKGREQRNPGEFDYNNYLHSIDISGVLTVYDKKDIKIISEDVEWFETLIFNSRKAINKIIGDLHSKSTAALLKGLILADRSDISHEIKNQFIDAGVVHILAVSGLHLGFIALIFYVLLGRLNLYLRSFLTITGILLFTILTGVPPSVFRAAVMTIIVIMAFLLNRTTNIYNSLSIAALIILIFNPDDLFGPGFQLSFSAVLSIAYFYPVFKRMIENSGIRNSKLKSVFLFAAVSLSAQIGTLPFTLYYFGRFSIFSVFANLLIIPLTGFILGTAFITLILSPISVQAASVYAAANDLFSKMLFMLAELGGSIKISVISFPGFSVIDVIFFCLFVFAGIFFIRMLSSNKSKIILISLILANIMIYTALDDNMLLPDNKLSVYMIDVGQGDSFLIKFPNGETALIDAGNATHQFDNGKRVILPLMNKLGIKKIDYGFVSHIDADHYGGFIQLIENEKIKKIIKPLCGGMNEKDIKFEKFLKINKIPLEYFSNQTIRIGNADIFVLNDIRTNTSDRSVSINNSSGVMKVLYGSTSFLFTGDLEKSGEKYYINKYSTFLKADVLKPGHHGSKTSSSKEFIRTVSPDISMISCGTGNKFGHPSNEVVSRLVKNNSRVYRTDHNGGLLLQSDGEKIIRVDWRNYY